MTWLHSAQAMTPIRDDRGVRLLLALAAVATLLGLWFAFAGLGARALWLDEAFSVHDAQRPLLDMLAMRSDRGAALHPPVYPALLRASIQVCGTSEVCVRAPSALAAAGACGALVMLAGRLFGWVTAITAAWLWPTLPYLLKYAQQARGYTLLLLLTAVALLLVGRTLGAWGNPAHRRLAAAGLGLCVAAMVGTHLLAGAFVAPLGLVAVLFTRRATPDVRKDVRRSLAVAAVGILPLGLAFFGAAGGDGGGRFASTAGPSTKVAELAVALVTLSTYTPVVPVLLLAAVFFTPARARRLVLVGLGLAVVPLAPLLLRTPAHFLVLRYFMPSVAVAGTLACAGVAAAFAAPARLPVRLPATVSLALGLLLAVVPARMLGQAQAANLERRARARSLEPWDEAAAWIDARATTDSVLVLVPHRILQTPLEVYPVAPAIVSDDPDALLERLRDESPSRVFVLWSHIDSRAREKGLNAVLGIFGRARYRPADNKAFGKRAIIVKQYDR
ncbi:MAG: glycosyltransferase family 39 protein [Myxococcota bacterium]